MPIVDIFATGRLTEFGLPQARGQPPVVALRECTVDEEPETCLEAERRDVRHLELFDEGVVHTGQFQGLQFVECGMREH
jgi:hypothetical protein